MVNLHIIPTVHDNHRNDYVMLIPAMDYETPDEALDYMIGCRVEPAVVVRDYVFAALDHWRRIYDDVIVHTVPL